MPSSPSSPSRPQFLPVELQKEILRFCDQSTLAKTSTLSLAFLQLSSPLLYRHIVFEGSEPSRKFLSLVAEKRHPELEPWLDLSLVHSVTYVDVEEDLFTSTKGQTNEPLQPRRLLLPSSSTPGRLPIHLFNVVLLEGLTRTLLPTFFDPVVFRLSSATPNPREVPCFDVDITRWTRLQELVFEGAFLYNPLMGPEMENAHLEGKVRILYDLSLEDLAEEVLHWISADLDTEGERYQLAASHIGEVVIRVCTNKQKEFLLADLEGSAILPRITIVVKPPPTLLTA